MLRSCLQEETQPVCFSDAVLELLRQISNSLKPKVCHLWPQKSQGFSCSFSSKHPKGAPLRSRQVLPLQKSPQRGCVGWNLPQTQEMRRGPSNSPGEGAGVSLRNPGLQPTCPRVAPTQPGLHCAPSQEQRRHCCRDALTQTRNTLPRF